MRRTRPIVVTLAAAALVLGGCGGGDESTASTPSPSAPGSTTPTQAPVVETWPLTGLPAKEGEVSGTDHPVYVVKIDNTSPAAPQLGLGSADLVVEELVEGGSTRLAAFYHSRLPEKVGPVRSMRASDIGIVKPADAEMVTSGAATRTYKRIRDAGITWHEEGTEGIFRDSSRRAPYNLFADLTTIADAAKAPAEPPADYLSWAESVKLPAGKPARSIAASFSRGHTSAWTYGSGGYTLDGTYAASGDEFTATNVLVIRATLGDAGYRDPAGNPVPETRFEGSGKATLFHKGRAIEATWKKAEVGDQLILRTAAGELKVPAGRTWIELVPTGSGSVSYR